ncbi:MAG: SsrA-binding protein SmpB [Pseudomonadota bacterium]
MSKKSKKPSNNIAQNKKARHEYAIEERFEAGMVLTGWEVKALRAGKAQLVDSYVLLKNGEVWLLGAQIEPLQTASSHVETDPKRTRKLLLNSREIARIKNATERDGYTCIATSLFWKKHLVKCEIAIGKGKKAHDKRAADKQRDWNREKQRVVRTTNR